MSHRNGGAAVVESLTAHGVDTVFGIPGTHNLEIYRHLQAEGVHTITPRHEQGAGYAAEAYARVSGRPAVVVTTSGPGLTNVMTAAATAYAESQPMLIVSPGMPTGTEGRDLGQLHEAKNTSAAMGELVAWSRRVGTADEAAEAVTAAFSGFVGGRPRPVHIEVPVDVLTQDWSGRAHRAEPAAAPVADAVAVVRAAETLAAAHNPVIIAGGGAVGAQQEITALSEALAAPVATTVNGKGVVDEGHALSVGASVRLRALQKAAADSDALLVIGSELGDSDLWEGRSAGAPSSGAISRPHSSTRTVPPTTGCTATPPPPPLRCAPRSPPAGRTGWGPPPSCGPRAEMKPPVTRVRMRASMPRSVPPFRSTGCSPGTAPRSPISGPCISSTCLRRAASATHPVTRRWATVCRLRSAPRWAGRETRSRSCSATAR